MIIFDWDGTLCDSVEQIVGAMRATAHELDIASPTAAQIRDIIGLGLPEAMAILFPSVPAGEHPVLVEGYSRHFVAAESVEGSSAKLFPGAMQTLQALRERGFELGVATGKSRRGLNRVLGRLDMVDFFDATRCADETRSKPDPLMLQELMVERGKPAQQMIMVGDTEYDLDMAARAGVRSVGVSFGVHSIERLSSHAPLAIIDSLPELLELELTRGRSSHQLL